MKKVFQTLKVSVILAGLLVGLSVASAWSGPGGAPPTNDAKAPINVGPLGQSKQGNLIIDGLNELGQAYQNGLLIMAGNVGIGTSTPRQKMSVNGVVGAREVCIIDNNGTIIGPCLSESGTTPPPPPPAVSSVSLAASPVTITSGQSATLSWTSNSAINLSINQGIGTVPASGSRTVSPTTSTTYTITGTGSDNSVVASSATVTVSGTPPPAPIPTVTLASNKIEIIAGSSLSLSWTATNATSLSINNGVGAVTSLSSGSKTVSPTSSVTYTITAIGSGGTATASVSVAVIPATPLLPVVTVAADKGYNFTGKQIAIFGNRLYAYSWAINKADFNGVDILDISNPLSPRKIGFVANTPSADSPKSLNLSASGNYLYTIGFNSVDSSIAFRIYDVSDAGNPTLLSFWSSLQTLDSKFGTNAKFKPLDFVISGDFAYVYGKKIIGTNTSDVLAVLDLSNKSNPGVVGLLGITPQLVGETIRPMAVDGNYVFSVSNDGKLQIINVQDKTNPVIEGSLSRGTSGAVISSYSSIFVDGDYVYLAEPFGLEIVDVSSHGSPVLVGKLSLPSQSSAFPTRYLTKSSNNIYLRSENSLTVVDVSNPNSPVSIKTIANGEGSANLLGSGPILLRQNYIFTPLSSTYRSAFGFEVMDVTNSVAPAHAKTYYGDFRAGPELYGVTSMVGLDDHLYLLNKDDIFYNVSSVQVVGLTSPTSLAYVTKIPAFGDYAALLAPHFYYEMLSEGKEVYLFQGVTKIDVSNPAIPVLKIAGLTPSVMSGGNAADISNSILYRTYGSTMDAFDYSGLSPVKLSGIGSGVNSIDSASGNRNAILSGNFFYVLGFTTPYTNGPRTYSLQVIDVSNPSSVFNKYTLLHDSNGPVLYSANTTPQYTSYNPISMSLAGNKIYVATGDTIEIISLADPAKPAHLNKISRSNRVYQNLWVDGNYAYLISVGSSQRNLLEIIDISNSMNPVFRGSIAYNNGFRNIGPNVNAKPLMYKKGNYIYLTAQAQNALEVINVSNPDSPTYAGVLRGITGLASNSSSTQTAAVGFGGFLERLSAWFTGGTNSAAVGTVAESISGGTSLDCVPKSPIDFTGLPVGARLEIAMTCTVK